MTNAKSESMEQTQLRFTEKFFVFSPEKMTFQKERPSNINFFPNFWPGHRGFSLPCQHLIKNPHTQITKAYNGKS
jgi:hypothetical protein